MFIVMALYIRTSHWQDGLMGTEAYSVGHWKNIDIIGEIYSTSLAFMIIIVHFNRSFYVFAWYLDHSFWFLIAKLIPNDAISTVSESVKQWASTSVSHSLAHSLIHSLTQPVTQLCNSPLEEVIMHLNNWISIGEIWYKLPDINSITIKDLLMYVICIIISRVFLQFYHWCFNVCNQGINVLHSFIHSI